ncbi:Acyl-CoA dehydrogenase, C-terminal:Acyl-CoA dehydrogenase, central region [Cupriavidus taiwanensis]|uniref:acyl-CoA dehydrogenase family protein n=1 Tax=Cupriavidus taiwanensis TaxID=164546 RepID=UPI000E17566E|nr:acyl-CoA dehydrogenase family protein [Cupriavidus taiwanensis]SPA23077.1 Acyl-CoA dehydrogenase, C-terminal:Acyl-CoA dehydrogenase, central region [Cupriavidus taiwanensis]
MNFNLTDEQRLLQDSVRRFVEKDYDFEARTARVKSGEPCNGRHWATFANNGWLAAALPEDGGGLGGTVIDTVLIATELGRGLVVEPYLGCAVLAAQTLAAAATPAQRAALLPALAEGGRRLALAYSEAPSRGLPAPVATRAEPAPGGFTLHGTKTLVLGGSDADGFIVSAREPGAAGDACSLFLAPSGAAGVERIALPLHDGSWAAEVRLDGVFVPADARLGGAGQGQAALAHGLTHAIAALCAELVGGMEQTIEITAGYLKVRKQFGVPIGSFQALQHRMADMAAELEVARSMLYALLASIENDDAAARARTVSQAKALIGRAARYVSSQGIQLHGGIGMTEEYIVGHYFKRAVVADALFGSADLHEAGNARALQADLTGKEAQA